MTFFGGYFVADAQGVNVCCELTVALVAVVAVNDKYCLFSRLLNSWSDIL